MALKKVSGTILSLTHSLTHSLTREGSVAGRWGDEEFVIILPKTTTLEALKIAERYRPEIANIRLTHKDQEITMSMTMGVSTIEKHEPFGKLISRADEALFKGKRSGRNIVMPAV